METIFWAILATVTWWTFAVALFGIMLGDGGKLDWKMVGFATIWPALVIPALVGITYCACVMSAERIRVDLKNRKLLREFEQWLAQRPKDD